MWTGVGPCYAVNDALDTGDPSLNFSGYGNSYTPGIVHQNDVVGRCRLILSNPR